MSITGSHKKIADLLAMPGETKPSWDSFFDHKPKADPDFLQDRSPVVAERCCMNGKIQFDGKDYYVLIPQELLDRAGIKVGDEVEISEESLPSGYKITIERSDLE